MSIIVKNGELFNPETKKSMECLLDMDLPVTVSYNIVKLIRLFNPIIEDINKSMDIIRDKHIEKDIEGNPIHPVDENEQPIIDKVKIKDFNLYNNDIEELMSMDNTFDGFEKIEVLSLKDMNIKPKVILSLEWLFN